MSASAVIVVGGLDPLGYSGILADARHLEAAGHPVMAVVSCLTEQSARRVHRVLPVPEEHVAACLSRLLEAAERPAAPGAVKLGLLHRPEVVSAVAETLRSARVPVVLDPVLDAGSGEPLVEPGTLEALLGDLLPLVTVLTPNVPELARLTGAAAAADLEERERQARRLLRSGPRAVLAKGGHAPSGDSRVIDLLVMEGGPPLRLVSPRFPGRVPRGTGCALSSHLAGALAEGRSPVEAARRAHERVALGIREAMERGSLRLG